MSNDSPVLLAIVLTAFDLLGEKTNIHFRSPSTLAVLIHGGFRLGGNVDASKLSRIVGVITILEMTSMHSGSRRSGNRAGITIWNAVTVMRRFCSSQFFHNNSPNCARLDAAMLMPDVTLPSLSKNTHKSSVSCF